MTSLGEIYVGATFPIQSSSKKQAIDYKIEKSTNSLQNWKSYIE